MVCVQKQILSLLVWSSIVVTASNKFDIIEVGSPSKRRAEILQAFYHEYSLNSVDDRRTIFPVGQVSPHEIVMRGCQPDAYFKECVLRVDGNKMAAAWLRDFFSDEDIARRISQESLDEMLVYAVEMPGVSLELIEQLLSSGADPCGGTRPSIEYIFNQCTSRVSDMESLHEKLYIMLEAMRKEPRLIQYANESLVAAHDRFMARIARRADCKDSLRTMFGEFGKNQSDEACTLYCHMWKKICELLSERRLRGSGDESSSPFRRKTTAFDKFATRCVDACTGRFATHSES